MACKKPAKKKSRHIKPSASVLGAGKTKHSAKKTAKQKSVSIFRPPLLRSPAGRLKTGTSFDERDAQTQDREMAEKQGLRKNTPRLKAYRQRHGIKEKTQAEQRRTKLEKEQWVPMPWAKEPPEEKD